MTLSVNQVPSLADQRSYWDERWARQRLPNDYQQRRGAAVLALVKSLRLDNPRILDFGCGTGWFTGQLSHLGEATGIDLSPVAIGVARASYPETRFVAGNLYETELAKERFDVVVSQEVVAHVENPDAYLDLISRVLVPRGYVIITTANRVVTDRWIREPNPDGHIERYPNRREFTRMLQPRFEVLRTTSIMPIGDQGFLRLVNSHKLNRLASRVISPERVERLKEWAGWGYTLIAVARKR
ncbi:MAG TPA: class I SAM-dependent methyltransferase [Gemmatimonadales bacterium]|nr:class I SAM-dependent methyltransferase [Gemmatimonadales bacterium]